MQKPKYITDEQWGRIVSAIQLNLPVGFEVGAQLKEDEK
jgi:hypothetical protein